MISSLIKNVTVAAAVADSQELTFTDQVAGRFSVPSGSSITAITWYTADRVGGGYLPAYDEANQAVEQTVAAGRSYELPNALLGAAAIKAVGNVAGTIDINLKS